MKQVCDNPGKSRSDEFIAGAKTQPAPLADTVDFVPKILVVVIVADTLLETAVGAIIKAA